VSRSGPVREAHIVKFNNSCNYALRWSRVAQSVQCLATGWTTGRSRFDPRQRQRIFPLASLSRPGLRPTQPPVQWVPGVLSPGLKRGRDVTLTTQPHLVPRSRMSRSYTSSLPSAFVGCSGTALVFMHWGRPRYRQCSKWTGICQHTVPVLLFVSEFHTGTYQYILHSFIFFVWLRAGLPGDRGSIRGRGERIFPLRVACVQTGSVAHSDSCTMGTGDPFPGAKVRPGRDANHSPPPSAEVVNE
jgi:hypothetical protein